VGQLAVERDWKYTLGELGELSKEEREQFYRERVWAGTPDQNARQIPRVQFLITFHAIEQYEHVLDIASGDGFATRWMADEESVKSVLGIDLCEKAIAMAKEYALLRDHPEKLHYYLDSWENIPYLFQGAEFDCIASFEFIEHIYYEEGVKLVKLMHDMLAPGGRAFLSTPERDGEYGLANDREREHLQLYTAESLTNLVREITGQIPHMELASGDILLCTWTKQED
jgi:2-polyprenyl-3-methyl-5-hydroxy-6-metoxy-1,4-benzoquinol methylase